MDNYNSSIIIGFSLILSIMLLNNKSPRLIENFTSGFGFEMPDNIHPLYLNMYKQNLSTDFKLFNLIQTIKYRVFKPIARGIYTNGGFGQVSLGPSLNPVIIVPGLGTSSILGIWNKPDSVNVKQLDYHQNFESAEKWNCRKIQNNWSELWFPYNYEESPETKGVAQYCWAHNINVKYKGKGPEKGPPKLQNSEGVITRTSEFGKASFIPQSYMYYLMDALTAAGYKHGTTLFGAPYDFRKICSEDVLYEFCGSLANLIQQSVQNNGKKAIILGHDLGSPLANYFLTKSSKEWKDQYIQSFISVSGAFGGCPKALRTLLSGVKVSNSKERTLLRKIGANFSGIQWMLPCPAVYGDVPLVSHKYINYSAKDIPKLLEMAGYDEAKDIYENIVQSVQQQSLQAPHVPVYVFGGDKIPTESNYNYADSLIQNPVMNYPLYKTDLPYNNNFQFTDSYDGDGTMPKFTLEVPLQWTNYQEEPIFYRFYNRAEHKEILELLEPVKDILSVITNS
jgi:lysophospholipase III